MSMLCLNVCRSCVPNVISLGVCFIKKMYSSKLARLRDTASKFALFSVSSLKDKKLTKKQAYTKTEICKLYSRVFWIFLPNFIKINRYNFVLYRFKFGAFFWDTVYYGCINIEIFYRIVSHIRIKATLNTPLDAMTFHCPLSSLKQNWNDIVLWSEFVAAHIAEPWNKKCI